MLINPLLNLKPTPEEKGIRGEWAVDRCITIAQKFGCSGRMINNVYVPNKQGKYTEIDVLYITRKGIFVFESKNYRGWIFGDGESNYWTLCASRHAKYKVYNPILQNQGHIRHLSAYVPRGIPFFSVIAYSGQCEIKKMSQVPVNTYMVHYYDIPTVMQQLWSTHPDVLSDNQVVELFDALVTLRTSNLEIINTHAQSVQNISNNLSSDNTRICPKCGRSLIIRTARKGSNPGSQFLGCSGYPQCTYTHTL